MNYSQLIPITAADMAAAVTGIVANPVFGTGLLVVIGAVLGPRILRAVFRLFGRG